jgi:YVTN family beta-propeller protein
VWVVDSLDDAVKRIDPGTQSVMATIPVGRSPAGVAFGTGSVWVANCGDGTVSRIDPKTDHASTIAVGGSPQAIAVDGDRAWVTVDAQAPRLSGPKRYLTYGRLDLDLARNAAPLAAFGNVTSDDFFSARIGCQTYGFYGMDLAAPCLRPSRHGAS